MVTKEKLKDYAAKLMFDMDDDGYDRTLKEFETIEKHMALIGEIDNIGNVEPMTFPYVIYHSYLREDEVKEITLKWLERNNIIYDKREGYETKKIIFNINDIIMGCGCLFAFK